MLTHKVFVYHQIRNSRGPSLMRMLANGDYVRYSTLFPKHLGMFGTLQTICRREGPLAMYSGITAGLQRQLCFSTIRIGFYDDVKKKYQTMSGHSKQERQQGCIEMNIFKIVQFNTLKLMLNPLQFAFDLKEVKLKDLELLVYIQRNTRKLVKQSYNANIPVGHNNK